MENGFSRILVTIVLAAGVAACSSVPSEIRNPAEGRVTVQEVREAPEEHEGQPVRWGGTIVALENHEAVTWVEVLAMPLNYDGRPRDADTSDGRFIAKVPGFLEPGIYEAGRSVTVYGHVETAREGRVGQRPYLYPIMEAEMIYLWEQEE